jgi:hypothetical protein
LMHMSRCKVLRFLCVVVLCCGAACAAQPAAEGQNGHLKGMLRYTVQIQGL